MIPQYVAENGSPVDTGPIGVVEAFTELALPARAEVLRVLSGSPMFFGVRAQLEARGQLAMFEEAEAFRGE